MPNPLKRGADPYADAEVASQLVQGQAFRFTAGDYDVASTPVYVIAPYKARVRQVRIVVRVLTAGAGLVTISANGQTLATQVIPTATAAAVAYNIPIADSANNEVAAGALITLISDGVPTAGELQGLVYLEPST